MKLKVLELYSGIGGMHFALKESHLEYEIVLAIDINTTANKVYKHNFADTNLQSFGIEKLSLKMLEDLQINTILMSPPCQPFTRVGKKRDCHDVRTKSFLHILDLIKLIKVKPVYILVENVKGFETSETRGQLIECLKYCNYTYQEFLLTPLQFGIPNSRLRYYLTAKWNQAVKNTNFLVNDNSESLKPICARAQSSDLQGVKTQDSQQSSDSLQNEAKSSLKDFGRNMRYCEEDDKFINDKSLSLSEYMETSDNIDLQDYWLSDKELRMFVIMDVVYPELKKSICFTKRYGHYIEGAGSVVQMSSDIQVSLIDLKHQAVNSLNRNEWGESEMEILRNLHLRYFTPREVANLLCFPKDFSFPDGLTKVQKYRVLGNSLNVFVVTQLIQFMTKIL
ncbi:tRNA (cytosine(38)-C(5))-methyltransferase-like [Biomphalaria glabrata]|uniref:tRNA (cytosine(38)-C(5))-methyltransferase n=1 Tax=Biomphalaria glabrata TaxID=6526 RepID=A0A0H3VB34_BIOGL|nr:tRNA (cytosine(38)-C(5))-methyltransferase-like [Biomphalaria glabrata]AJT59485.1 DNA methyltransferase 2 isoform 1 [Biomphalaria glabrata]